MSHARAALLANHFADRSLTGFAATGKALRSWGYWCCTREGATRRREVAAIDDILRLCEPNYREMVERIVKWNIVRESGWWDVPDRWRTR